MERVIVLCFVILFLVYYFIKKPIILYRPYEVYGYTQLKQNKSGYTEGGIPKIIIKTSFHKRERLPLQIISSLEETKRLNPGYTIYYFDNDDINAFMNDFSPDMFELYKKLVPGAFKADLFRVCGLYYYGGCYSDIGHIPLVSFDTICQDANIVLVSDAKVFDFDLYKQHNIHFTGIHNALMCSVPKHGFFKALIDKITENIANDYYGENSLDVTGPTIIGKVFNCYFEKQCDYINKDIMVYGTTDYGCKKCKVKILKLTRKIFEFKDTFYIQDYNNTDLIQTKFDDYYYVMYRASKTPRYTELWDKRQIYN